MKEIKYSRSFPTLNNIHTSDNASIVNFLNNISKDIGAIKYLASFADNLKVKNDIGIKAEIKFLIIERSEYSKETPGNGYTFKQGPQGIFEIKYNLPEDFPVGQIENEFIIKSTVQTHECSRVEDCPKCEGSGECIECSGSRSEKCRSCNGSGEMRVHDGKYYETFPCKVCKGSGNVPCKACIGNGKCNACAGKGKIKCSKCEGSGSYQSFMNCKNIFTAIRKEFYYSDYQELYDLIPKIKGVSSFDDELMEWENMEQLLFDQSEKAIEINRHFKHALESFSDLVELEPNQKFGRIYAVFENVPITVISYIFEDKQYQLFIVGKDNLICYNDVPKKHSYEGNIFSKFSGLLNKKERRIAFVYIACYMFHVDNRMNESETNKLVGLFLNSVKMNDEERLQLISNLKKPMSINDIAAKTKVIRGDKRALVFAWQCAMQGTPITETQIAAFGELFKLLNIGENEIENIKQTASKFAQLNEEQLLEEYFK